MNQEVTDWSKYMADPEEAENLQPDQQKEPDTSPVNWNRYREKEPGVIGESVRHVARTASRGVETILGFPGDILNLALDVGEKFKQDDPNFIQKIGRPLARKIVPKIPTSESIKKKMGEITGGFTDPQSAAEEFSDSAFELASILMWGKDPRKALNFFKSIAKAFTAKGTAKGAEKFGFGPVGQTVTELGTLFMMSVTDPNMARRFVSDKYKTARNLIPKNTMVDTSKMVGELDALERELSKGLSTASKNEVKNAVTELRGKVSGGAYPADELVDAFHDINERMSSKKLFEELSRTERRKLKFRYDKFKDVVGNEVEDYGKSNPEFFKEWKEANSAHATVEKSKRATSFLEKHVGRLPSKVAQGMAVELFLGHPKLAAATGASFVALKTSELMYRVFSNKTLTKHYADVVKHATAENLPAMAKSLEALENGLRESFLTEDESTSK